MNHFANGLLHPLMTPAHVLILLGLGVWLGQHVPLRLRMPLLAFASFSAIGLALTTTGWIPSVHPAVLACIALGAGAVVALGKDLPPLVRGAFFAAGALAVGLDSGPETGSVAAVIAMLLGTWISLIVCLMNVAYYSSLAAEQKRKWLHIGLRVAGSWIVAISLLVLAFALRK
jgi:urease accessory protein